MSVEGIAAAAQACKKFCRASIPEGLNELSQPMLKISIPLVEPPLIGVSRIQKRCFDQLFK